MAAQLRYLDLGQTDELPLAYRLANGDIRPLTVTCLRQARFTSFGRRIVDLRLARSECPPRAKLVNVTSNEIGVDGARAIGASPLLGNLKQLHLSGSSIGSEGARALAESVNLGALEVLDLSRNSIGDDGAGALARSTSLQNVCTLRLHGCGITEKGAEALRDRTGLPALRTLGLSSNSIHSGRSETYYDWDGSAVAEGPEKVSIDELRRRYGARFWIE
jgi:hypothetical protein